MKRVVQNMSVWVGVRLVCPLTVGNLCRSGRHHTCANVQLKQDAFSLPFKLPLSYGHTSDSASQYLKDAKDNSRYFRSHHCTLHRITDRRPLPRQFCAETAARNFLFFPHAPQTVPFHLNHDWNALARDFESKL